MPKKTSPPPVRIRQVTLNIPSGPGSLYAKLASLRQEYHKSLRLWASEHDFLLYVLEVGAPQVERQMRRIIAPSIIDPSDASAPRSILAPST
jgi:hypothetical protein